jgi:hypothetical protein
MGSHNTCGAWSPTRPGVIFITKTDGIDVWDFLDQSNKPSMNLILATSAITFFKFQTDAKPEGRQFIAWGDATEGTLNLHEVPHNLCNPQANGKEEEIIKEFWLREIDKNIFVKS